MSDHFASGISPQRARFARLFSQRLAQGVHPTGSVVTVNNKWRDSQFVKKSTFSSQIVGKWKRGEALPRRKSFDFILNRLYGNNLDCPGAIELISAYDEVDAHERKAIARARKGGAVSRHISSSVAAVPSVEIFVNSSSMGKRSLSIIPNNPFPKLCYICLDIPDQGSSPSDFIVIGELRFGRAPDVVGDLPVVVGVRRAVMLPILTGCYPKPGSLYRPKRGTDADMAGAAQVVFQVVDDSSGAVLEGEQLKGEAFGRFVTTGEMETVGPELEVLVQLEAASDLSVELRTQMPGRSAAQVKLAEAWISEQLARTVEETDGSLRIGACLVRWKSDL